MQAVSDDAEGDAARASTRASAGIGRQGSAPPGPQVKAPYHLAGRRFRLAQQLDLRSPTVHRTFTRYALALVFVFAAYLAALVLVQTTGKFAAFPFYAAVVAGAWIGVGPGMLAFALSAVAAADFWTSDPYSFYIQAVDLPSFVAFVVFALMSLAWSAQRRRAHSALEAMVQERTAELVRANSALKAEMTERAATERALRDAEAELARTLRMATMAEFAAAIAHEVNQPLAAITANGSACLRSLQRDPPLLDNAREAAACIVADGHRAADVIARIRALFNKEPPRKQLLSLNEVVRGVLDLARGQVERRRVDLRAELEESAPMVMADRVQLQQVIVNLITNGLEAMSTAPDGQRRLTVRSKTEGDRVTVTVEDTGTGIDDKHISNIFDSFYTTKPGGIGIGLAISRSIIEAHGGAIWAAPAVPNGAAVGFSLPLAAAAKG